jgi:hypothetical protein
LIGEPGGGLLWPMRSCVLSPVAIVPVALVVAAGG